MVDELKRWSGKGGFQGLITHFKEEGAVDELLVSLILQKSKSHPTTDSERVLRDVRIEKKAQAIQDVTINEANKLRTEEPRKEALSNSKWARLLGYASKQGAFSFLNKMENKGFLKSKKHENGGTEAFLTDLGKEKLLVLRV